MHDIQKKYWEKNNLDNRKEFNHPAVEIFSASKINEIKKY